jgi:hypothetical protein
VAQGPAIGVVEPATMVHSTTAGAPKTAYQRHRLKLTPAEAVTYVTANVQGLTREQAEFLFQAVHKRGGSVVFGGSRVRGAARVVDGRVVSDLDVGFVGLSRPQISRIMNDFNKAFTGSSQNRIIEHNWIYAGAPTQNIPEIASPEEFFLRSGTRKDGDKAGQAFGPSGYIRVDPEGTVEAGTVPPAGVTHAGDAGASVPEEPLAVTAPRVVDAGHGAPAAEPEVSPSGSSSAATNAEPVPASGEPGAAGHETSGRVSGPVEGLVESVDAQPNKLPASFGPGWSVDDAIPTMASEPSHKHFGEYELRTTIRGPQGGYGRLIRYWNPTTGVFTMDEIVLNNLPKFVHEGVALVPGQGTPLVTYLSLRQMKLLKPLLSSRASYLEHAAEHPTASLTREQRLANAANLKETRRVLGSFGDSGVMPIRTVRMAKIRNPETMLELTDAMKAAQAAGGSEAEVRAAMERALANSQSVRYAETVLEQAGYKLTSPPRLVGGKMMPIGESMRKAQTANDYSDTRDMAMQAKHVAMLKERGMMGHSEAFGEFDIEFDVAPIPGGPAPQGPPPGVAPSESHEPWYRRIFGGGG